MEDIRNINIELLPSQVAIIQSKKKIRWSVSGIGGGKTFTLGSFIAIKQLLTNPMFVGLIGFIGAPTYDQLNRSTIPGILKALEKYGLVANKDYVINTRPPASWGVEPFSFTDNSNILTAKNGAFFILDYVQNGAAKHRGTELDIILLDEVRDIDAESLKTLEGRLRGECFKVNKFNYVMICVTTPPDDLKVIFDAKERAIKQGDLLYVSSKTHDNSINLPDGYISSLINSFGGEDSPLVRREIYGEAIDINNQAFFYGLNLNMVKHSGLIKIYPQAPIYISHDYNYGKLCGVIAQFLQFNSNDGKIKYQLNIIDNPITTILDVQRHVSQNIIYTASSVILKKYKGYEMYYCGDRSGGNGAVSSPFYDKSPIEQFKDCLDIPNNNMLFNQYNYKYPKTNPTHRYSYVLCNKVFIEVEVNISDVCIDLISDLRAAFVEISKTGKLNLHKDNGVYSMGSADAFRYLIHSLFGEGSSFNIMKDFKM